MLKIYRILFGLCLTVLFGVISAHSAVRTTSQWRHTAEEIYNEGFMNGLMRNGDGGVRLFNIELIENDSPGAGYSEKGIFTDTIWGKNRARKIFKLDDPRSEKAYLIVYMSRWQDES